jgi:hypothetical protein
MLRRLGIKARSTAVVILTALLVVCIIMGTAAAAGGPAWPGRIGSAGVRASEPADGAWVLTQTLVNPDNAQTEYYGGGATPGWFTEPRFEGKFTKYSVSATSFGVADREVDHGIEYHNVTVVASFQQPPAELVPGVTVDLTATFSHSGTADDGGIGILFWYTGKGVGMQPSQPFSCAPWNPASGATSSAMFSFVVPPTYSGAEIEIRAAIWNAAPCYVAWKYRAQDADDPGTTPDPDPGDEEPPAQDEPRKPIIILPGIYGSYMASWNDHPTWVKNRGIHPNLLAIDPLAHYYDDIIVTLKNAGYVEGEDLFAGAYDWRLPPGPVDGTYDGVIGGISGVSITDDLYEYGVDYLGYYLKQAAEKWRQNHEGQALDSVDIISHSTGGLVARAYIQSTAYGKHFRASDGAAVRLPTVNHLVMVAVPNRGAALPWQAMNNNFRRDDPTSKYVMSKIIAVSYYKLQQGDTIQGPPAPITPASITDPATGQPDPVRFVALYCPTFRSLLATYPFIRKPDGSLVDLNGLPQYRNDLVLDLNNGLDLPDRPASADPNLFADAVNHTTVFYAGDLKTAHQMQEMNTAASNVLFPLDATFDQDAAAGTTWYRDIVAEVGDETVPGLSAAGQFQGDSRIKVVQVSTDDRTHTGLMANPKVQMDILLLLGTMEAVTVSTGLAKPSKWNVAVAVSDPVGFVMVDGQARRLGWTAETGVLTEIPGSIWYGEADGIGIVFGDVPQPLRVELLGMGDDYLVQVVGEQVDHRIGLKDEGILANGEKTALDVQTRDKLGASNGSIALWLIGVLAGMSALVIAVLAGTLLARRRRRARAPAN